MAKPKLQRDPYVAIMRAAARGAGLTLTAREVSALSLDTAIETAATNVLTDAEVLHLQDSPENTGWRAINPRRQRSQQ